MAVEELALLHRYRDAGDTAARDQLVARMLPWVRKIALRYANRGQELDDLIQVGSVGLLKAIERFDFERGFRLTTFAEPTVTGEIKRHFRDHGWSVRPPRDLQELNADVMRAIDGLSAELQRSPTVAEIADYLKMSSEDVLNAIQAGAGYDTTPLLSAEDPDSPNSAVLATTDERLGRTEWRSTLKAAIEPLSERDKTIVHMRFFQDLTQSEIAAAIGISQMQVSRILRSALQHIRKTLSNSADQPPS